jgi:hypothetical protein
VVVALAVPDRPAPDGEQARSDRDADGRPVRLEIPRQDNSRRE